MMALRPGSRDAVRDIWSRSAGTGRNRPGKRREVAAATGDPASRITLRDEEDPFEYCRQKFGDALPVIPPTVEKVEAMVKASGLAPETVIARVPPFYGEATVEKIAANAVMAGCVPEMMRVLLPLLRAACDERFNLHGVQATTHFAAPLVMINGPVRQELGFWSKQNVFSNVARANSSLGRAFQLILLNIGGGRPDGIDMSALGNPGKFSFCIAENEEENPWEPFHVTRGLKREQSAVSLFAAEPPRGVSEHTAPAGKTVLETISFALATVWSYRTCLMPEAIVILCPEHVKTIHRDGITKEQARQFLFENTGDAGAPLFERRARGRHAAGGELQRDHACAERSATRNSGRQNRSAFLWRAERQENFPP